MWGTCNNNFLKILYPVVWGTQWYIHTTYISYILYQAPTPNRDIPAAANIILGIGVGGLSEINRQRWHKIWFEPNGRIGWYLISVHSYLVARIRGRYLSPSGFVWSAMGSGFTSTFKWFIINWTHAKAPGVTALKERCISSKAKHVLSESLFPIRWPTCYKRLEELYTTATC